MEKTYNFDIEIGALYWNSFESNLKKAQLYDHVEGYVVTNGFLCRKYHIKGASQNFVDYVTKLIKIVNK
jgi:hypothetical protein